MIPLQPGEYIRWPTSGWKTKKPKNVGMDEALVAAMIEDIDQSGLSLDGIVVIYKGAIVVEKYFHVYRESTFMKPTLSPRALFPLWWALLCSKAV